jgi:hypothetical protein
MDRYTFCLSRSGVRIAGQRFANKEAACREAQTVARELRRNNVDPSPEYLELLDEKGRLIYQEPLF